MNAFRDCALFQVSFLALAIPESRPDECELSRYQGTNLVMCPLQIGCWQAELWKLSLTLAELRQAKTMDKKVYQFESVFLSDMLALTFTSP